MRKRLKVWVRLTSFRAASACLETLISYLSIRNLTPSCYTLHAPLNRINKSTIEISQSLVRSKWPSRENFVSKRFWKRLKLNGAVKIWSESKWTMRCFPNKEKPLPPLYYAWSASWMCYPKDNLKCEHKYAKPEKKKNFDRINKEAIAKIRKRFLDRTRPEAIRTAPRVEAKAYLNKARTAC